jgi:hypothetical protein
MRCNTSLELFLGVACHALNGDLKGSARLKRPAVMKQEYNAMSMIYKLACEFGFLGLPG